MVKGCDMRRWKKRMLAVIVVGVIAAVVYVRASPLTFNESLWHHAHCIKIAGLALHNYAEANGGRFPTHPNGYGNALLLLNDDLFFALTGPMYDAAAFHDAKRSGRILAEEECGRVYVQGLTLRSDSQIVVLFDKCPTPGGDHRHFPDRLWAPLGREVLFVDGTMRFVLECDWPAFARNQIELLEKNGIARAEAERLYASPHRK